MSQADQAQVFVGMSLWKKIIIDSWQRIVPFLGLATLPQSQYLLQPPNPSEQVPTFDLFLSLRALSE